MENWNLDVRAFQPNSLNEWAGNISAVIFFGGCNWSCPYCHNYELSGESAIDPNEVLSKIASMKYLDGVVLSGGEATLQPHLARFAKAIKSLGLKVKLFSNGSRPSVILEMVSTGVLDCVSLDYKTLPELLPSLLGAKREDIENVACSFLNLKNSGVDREYRTTLCPAVVTPSMLLDMATRLDNDGLWILQQYGKERVLDISKSGERVFSDKELESILSGVRGLHKNVVLRKGTS